MTYISNCCGVSSDHYDISYIGKCPECGEGCAFEPVEEYFEEQEEKLLPDRPLNSERD